MANYLEKSQNRLSIVVVCSQSMKKIFVTGAAGFIGSNLVDFLLSQGLEVVGWDNYSTGQERFLESAKRSPLFRMMRGDTLDLPGMTAAMAGCDQVFHFAANADVRFGLDHPRRDLEQNTIATFNVLEAMRANKVPAIGFSSTGSVYGECTVIPTPENAPFPIQTSLYGASKLAGEGMIAAYAEGFGIRATIFRFVSILGDRYTHGHIFDFYNALKKDPSRLRILGNGAQRKSYLNIHDCVRAILCAVKWQATESSAKKLEIFNLGTTEYCEVKNSAGWISASLGLSPTFEYSGGERGWVGDNPFILLATDKIRSIGWKAEHSIQDSVLQTVAWLRANEWVYDARGSN